MLRMSGYCFYPKLRTRLIGWKLSKQFVSMSDGDYACFTKRRQSRFYLGDWIINDQPVLTWPFKPVYIGADQGMTPVMHPHPTPYIWKAQVYWSVLQSLSVVWEGRTWPWNVSLFGDRTGLFQRVCQAFQTSIYLCGTRQYPREQSSNKQDVTHRNCSQFHWHF